MPARDTQRSKVYAAEWALFVPGSQPELTLDECTTLVEKISASKRVQEKYRHRRPDVRDGRSRRRACYEPDAHAIRLPRWSRQKWVVLHEMAHCLVYGSRWPEPAWHGWEFCECYLWLVRIYMGRHVEQQLAAEFKQRNVKYRPPRKRSVTPEQREAARQRMIAINQQRQTAAA